MNSKNWLAYSKLVTIFNQKNKDFKLSMHVLKLEVVREVEEEEEVQNRK